jgi:diguanylate cyclase (GGDEF)-like protein
VKLVSRLLKAEASDPKWLGAVACLAMGMGVSAIDLAITSPAVASRAAFAMDAAGSGLFLVVLLGFRDRLPDGFFGLVTVVCTGLITATIGLNPRRTGNEAYYMLVILYSSYFFARRGAILQTALVILAYCAVTFATVHNGSEGARCLNFSGVVAVLSGVVLMLRARLDALISSLNEAALTDSLTGLLNRRAFEARIAEEAARSAREQAPLSMLALDIDHFKHVNDHFGHPTGDAVLAAIAGIVARTARAGDIVARIGGEEFSVLLVGAGRELATNVAERIRRAVEDSPLEPVGRLTVSVGVAELDVADEAPAIALQRDADRVLYVAKETGRNRVVRCERRVQPAPGRPVLALGRAI